MFAVSRSEQQKNTHSELTEWGENIIGADMKYKFSGRQLEERARDWFKHLETASDVKTQSRPSFSKADLMLVYSICKRYSRLKWLMPMIIETVIEEGQFKDDYESQKRPFSFIKKVNDYDEKLLYCQGNRIDIKKLKKAFPFL